MTAYDVIVLDRDLPRVHGDAVCTTLAATPTPARILLLTAASTVSDRVDGLNLGADDYLTKPFAFAELVARVRALARRAPAAPPVMVRGELVLDRARRRASRDGRPLSLTRKELAILEELMVADGAVVSAEDLLDRVWDENADPFTRTVTVTLARLEAQARRARPDRDGGRQRLPAAMTGPAVSARHDQPIAGRADAAALDQAALAAEGQDQADNHLRGPVSPWWLCSSRSDLRPGGGQPARAATLIGQADPVSEPVHRAVQEACSERNQRPGQAGRAGQEKQAGADVQQAGSSVRGGVPARTDVRVVAAARTGRCTACCCSPRSALAS